MNKYLIYFKLIANKHGLPVLLLLVMTLIAGSVLGQLATRVLNLHRQVAQVAQNVDQLEKVNAQALSLKADIAKIQSQSDELSNMLPTRKEVLQNIQLLETIAAETANQQNINITELPPDPKRKTTTVRQGGINVSLPSKFSSVDYTISLTGNYLDLIKYLELIEHEPFLTLIRRVNITADKAGSTGGSSLNTGLINTTLDATLFYTKDQP